MALVDLVVRDPERDDETVRVLVGTEHDRAAVRMALNADNRPLAVSSYTELPPEGRALLPTEEDPSRVVRRCSTRTARRSPAADGS